ncbi:PEP-CTERM sorting domain-containing protein [Akkermansiaceae bacterium]|nr:PEP-CTERM sorting domain-containing protein [Akkermansiaceae bacterium]MDB4781962.1 PEP-CTERM sorting domain-containing protein [Akkermansiaceae bacterium]
MTFDTGQADNDNLNTTFASNLSADIAGANISNGATPNIGLTWAPYPHLDVHGTDYWNDLDPTIAGSVVDVLQLDINSGEPDPTITFAVGTGKALKLNSLDIGHETYDLSLVPYAWIFTISEVGGPQVFTHTTALLGPGDTESVNFNFTGDLGVDYVLKLDDGGADTLHAAIDNLSFNQIPEPATFGLVGAFGLGMLFIRRRLMM